MRKLESFKLPTSIKKDYPEAPTKLRKIFRDEDCLTPGGNSLPQKIQDELKNSKYLVVVCSMNSAKSDWVNDEVEFFKKLKREKFIIPYIIDGEPNSEDDTKECYMPELRSITGKDELYAVNIAENGDKHAQVKVIAGLIDVKFDRLWQRERRAERRKRFIVISSVVAFALVSLFVALWMWNMKNKADAERDKAYMAQSRAVAGMVKQNMDKEDVVTSIAVLLEVLPDSIDKPNRPFVGEPYQILNECNKVGLRNVFVDNSTIISASFSPNRKHVVTVSRDSTAKIWDVETGNLLKTTQFNNGVWYAEYSPDGKYIVTAYPGNLLIWDSNMCKIVHDTIQNNGWVTSVSFSPNNKYLMVNGWYSVNGCYSWKIIDVMTGKPLSIQGHEWFTSIDHSPVTDFVVTTVKGNDTAVVWNVGTKELLWNLPHDGTVKSAKFSRCGQYIVTASEDKTARIWSMKTGKTVGELFKHNDVVLTASFSKNGNYIVTSANDKIIRIWDVKTGDVVSSLCHDRLIKSASFIHDDEFVLTYSPRLGSGTASLWCTETGKLSKNLLHSNDINNVSFCSNGEYLLSTTHELRFDAFTGNNDNVARLWKVNNENNDIDTLHHRNKINSISYSPDSQYLITTESNDDTARIWNAKTGKLSMKLPHNKAVKFAEYSQDGEKIVSTLSNSAIVWNVKTSDIVCETEKHNIYFYKCVRFSNDGNYIITIANDDINVWDAKDGKLIKDSDLGQTLLKEIDSSPDGKYLIFEQYATIASSKILVISVFGYELPFELENKTIKPDSKSVMIVDAITYNPVNVLWHNETVISAMFSPNSRYILTSSYDDYVRIRAVTTGECIFEEKGNHIAMSPDMKTIAIAKGNEVIIKPFMEPQQLITKYRKIFKNYKLSREDRRKYFLE